MGLCRGGKGLKDQAAELCFSKSKRELRMGLATGEMVAGCPLLPKALCRLLSCSLDPGRSDSHLVMNVEGPHLPPPSAAASTTESLYHFLPV